MHPVLQRIRDVVQGRHPSDVARSPKWPALRKEFLKGKRCAVCNGTDNLEAHHKMPFHLDREKELDPKNLIALCEAKKDGVNCHLLFGHLGNFKSYNPAVTHDAEEWKLKIESRR